jgi:formylglycine-generating enzyme
MTSRTPVPVALVLAAGVWLSPMPDVVVGVEARGVPPKRETVRIPRGSYLPLYAPPASDAKQGDRNAPARSRVVVEVFEMDALPVTNAKYLEFVRAHPESRRSRVARLFADVSYLHHWRDDLELGAGAPADSPVVYISWFAAQAYLRTVGKMLPTVDQWEYAAAASETRRDASRDPAFLERQRQWYGRPTPPRLPAAGSGFWNVYGLADLHGLVWEWTLDFNSALVTGESRADSALDRTRYCGSGASGASDFEDYAAFMRYAFRSSLEARYSVGNLGFRGVNAPAKGTR